MAALVTVGCASNTISLRSVPKSPLVAELDLTSYSGPKASARTTQLLRVYNLSDELGTDFRPVLQKLQAINDREPSADNVYALSELAFLGGKKAEAVRQGRGVGPLRRLGPARLRLSFRRPAGRHAEPLRSELSRRLRSVQRRVGGGLADRLRDEGTRARHHQDDQHGVGGVGHYVQTPGQPLAAGRLRAIRVRLRLEGQRAHEPLSDARLGRAADRRPPRPEERRNGRAGGGPVLSRGPEFPRDGVRASAVEDRPHDRPDRGPQPVRVGTVRSVEQRRDPGGRPAGAAGKRSHHAAGVLPLQVGDEQRGHARAAAARRPVEARHTWRRCGPAGTDRPRACTWCSPTSRARFPC